MSEIKKTPERGVGSNQYADKPPRLISDEDARKRKLVAGASADAVQGLAELDDYMSEKLDLYIESSSGGSDDDYGSFIDHPVNPYRDETTKNVDNDRATQEWSSMYSAQTHDGRERKWNPRGAVCVGYVATTPLGEPEFLVNVSGVTPPKEMLRHYGVDEHAALRYAEDDRIIIDGAGNYEDANSADAPPDLPAVPFTFLPFATQNRIKEIVHYHIQFGKVWEATYDERADEWCVLVRYGDCFKEEFWPEKQRNVTEEPRDTADAKPAETTDSADGPPVSVDGAFSDLRFI